MSNGLHPVGCIYDGEDLQREDFSIDLEITNGLDEVAEVRGSDTVVPAATGRRARNRVKDRRSLELAGWIQGNATASGGDGSEADRMASYREIVAFLQDLFDPARDPAVLEAPLEDGTTSSITARPLNIVFGERPVYGVARISIALESIDPEWTPGS